MRLGRYGIWTEAKGSKVIGSGGVWFRQMTNISFFCAEKHECCLEEFQQRSHTAHQSLSEGTVSICPQCLVFTGSYC